MKVQMNFTPGKDTSVSLYRRLGGLRGHCGRGRKITPAMEFDIQNIQPVASRYTLCMVLRYGDGMEHGKK